MVWSFFLPPTEGKTREVKMIFHSILCVKSELMRRALARAPWEDQESISGIGGAGLGQSSPSLATVLWRTTTRQEPGEEQGSLNEMLIQAT